MSIRTQAPALALAAAVAALVVPAEAKSQIADTASVTVQATVEGIDRTNRVVSLTDQEGNTAEFQVAEDVQRFDDLSVGDQITATYTEAIALTLRKPGDPAPMADETNVDQGTAMARRTLSVTVEAIDEDARSLTVRGPEGNEVDLHVPEGVSMDNVAVGDNIDLTYTIAMVVDIS